MDLNGAPGFGAARGFACRLHPHRGAERLPAEVENDFASGAFTPEATALNLSVNSERPSASASPNQGARLKAAAGWKAPVLASGCPCI